MCGILGCFHDKSLDFPLDAFRNSLEKISHRGPDNISAVEYVSEDLVFKFGHTRLSILDLNQTGNQPMISRDGRYVLIFNGEIYNHQKLRKELSAKYEIEWSGSSDSETLLMLLQKEQPKIALKRLEGMFAFSFFDRSKNTLLLARDHSGEKPLYVSSSSSSLSFSSDLNPLKTIPKFNNTLNKSAIKSFMESNYIPSPLSIYHSSFKIPAASLMILDFNEFELREFNSFQDLISAKGVEYDLWWKLDDLLDSKEHHINLSDEEIKKETHRLLSKSVTSQLISDVPLGAFLSGGIDSSLIVSLMQESGVKTKTFTVGFNFTEFDESVYAKEVADHLGTDHTSYICDQNDVFNLLPNLSTAFSEPFADSSQLPTMLVSKMAREKVTVALSGDGGDELFGGYNRYLLANKYWKYLDKVPLSVRSNLFKSIDYLPNTLMETLIRYSPLSKNLSGDKKQRVKKILSKIKSISTKESFYKSLVTEWSKDLNLLNFELNNEEPLNLDYLFGKKANITFEEAMMHRDFQTYLPDDILCKVDRSSMFSSLETRSPFLNRELVEFAYKQPLDVKIRNGETKWVLRELLKEYIPQNLFDRPKQGFGIPVSDWMRGELKDWVNDNLSSEISDSHGFFNQDVIEIVKNEHFSNKFNHEHKLWSLVQFNQWYQDNH